ncbi:MAG: cob(I)yrinic acid a,c-diamide adenosyltransferase [Anaerolineae bacterium]
MATSRFYTRRGDDGYTNLLGSERVPKYDPRPETYGAIDEAQAILGLVRASHCTSYSAQMLLTIQRDLSALMAELAAAGNVNSPFAGSITPDHVRCLEEWIAECEAQVQRPGEFVIPGGSQPGAALHLARTVVRRAERWAARLTHEGVLANQQVMRYLNRLSSLLFVLALYEDQTAIGHAPTLVKE